MIRAVCFDLDGTLVSSLPEIAEGVRRLALKEGFAPVPDEVVAVMIGGGVRVLVERLMPNDKLNLDSNDIIGILLAAAATLLCATIDYFTKENDDHD